MRLRPRLASHAPNVSKITLTLTFGAFIIDIEIGTNRTNLNVTPSRDRRAIKKCD
jgi:hypothetical protein